MSTPLGAFRLLAALLLATAGVVQTYTLDPNSTDSIKTISRQLADDMIDNFYFGHLPGHEPGLPPPPHYWWEGGALMGALIDYWHYTGDTKFNKMASEGLLAQVGEQRDYMPMSQVLSLGNDDQGFWGMAAMSAAEYRFPDPPPDQPQWLALAQAVFNTQASRWNMGTCNGGLHWQIFEQHQSFSYKNTISSGCLLNLAARLALYTGNSTYADWAGRTWDWLWDVGFINHDSWWVHDGADARGNCTGIVPYVWTYNTGILMSSVAAMYNYTDGQPQEQEKWRYRLDRLIDASKVFFNGTNKDVMTEVACEPVRRCNVDQQSFKAYLSRWMAVTTMWAPWTSERIMPLLRSSAVAATKVCTRGPSGRLCGVSWADDSLDDDIVSLGKMMSVLEVVVGLLADQTKGPVKDGNGGTSRGDPGAGGRDDQRLITRHFPPISPGDRAGAYLLTVASLLMMLAGMFWMVMDPEDMPPYLRQRYLGGTSHKSLAGKGKEMAVEGVAEDVENNINTAVMQPKHSFAQQLRDGANAKAADESGPPLRLSTVEETPPSPNPSKSSSPEKKMTLAGDKKRRVPTPA